MFFTVLVVCFLQGWGHEAESTGTHQSVPRLLMLMLMWKSVRWLPGQLLPSVIITWMCVCVCVCVCVHPRLLVVHTSHTGENICLCSCFQVSFCVSSPTCLLTVSWDQSVCVCQRSKQMLRWFYQSEFNWSLSLLSCQGIHLKEQIDSKCTHSLTCWELDVENDTALLFLHSICSCSH